MYNILGSECGDMNYRKESCQPRWHGQASWYQLSIPHAKCYFWNRTVRQSRKFLKDLHEWQVLWHRCANMCSSNEKLRFWSSSFLLGWGPLCCGACARPAWLRSFRGFSCLAHPATGPLRLQTSAFGWFCASRLRPPGWHSQCATVEPAPLYLINS